MLLLVLAATSTYLQRVVRYNTLVVDSSADILALQTWLKTRLHNVLVGLTCDVIYPYEVA